MQCILLWNCLLCLHTSCDQTFSKNSGNQKVGTVVKKNHQEQNQANGDTGETDKCTTTTDIKHIKSKLELDRALKSRIFKLSPKLFESCK